MRLQQLMSYVRRAVFDYNMIEEGDKIAVGLSGGKDSLALLAALKGMQRFYPKKYDLCAVTVSLGFDMDFSPLEAFLDELQVEYKIAETEIADIIFKYRKESNPCSLCSKMRKGALNETAAALGANKVALGHNKDDVIETFFMCLFFEGRVNTFSPVTFLDRQKLYTIRPLIYADERDIVSFAKKEALPVIKNACPADKNTKRQEIKEFIRAQGRVYTDFSNKVFGAVRNSDIKGWGRDC